MGSPIHSEWSALSGQHSNKGILPMVSHQGSHWMWCLVAQSYLLMHTLWIWEGVGGSSSLHWKGPVRIPNVSRVSLNRARKTPHQNDGLLVLLKLVHKWEQQVAALWADLNQYVVKWVLQPLPTLSHVHSVFTIGGFSLQRLATELFIQWLP